MPLQSSFIAEKQEGSRGEKGKKRQDTYTVRWQEDEVVWRGILTSFSASFE
jgi:hypothetical protein